MPSKRSAPPPIDPTLSAMHELEVQGLRAKLADLNEKHRHTVSMLQESDARLNAMLGLREVISGHPTKKPLRIAKKSKASESTAVLVTSDWHLEERVDPRTVDGVNEYNPEIAEARVMKFFANAMSMIDMCRTRSKIPNCVLAVLGDLITGTIHEDLAESNYLSTTEATLKAYRLLCGGIDFLLDEGDFEKIVIPCVMGNHGRSTRKPRVSTLAKNSYEWMMYHLCAERYADNDRVKFVVADGYLLYVEIYNTTIRFHHGDGIKYQGGVGGVTIPMNKAIAQWNKLRRSDVDVMGHWHTRITGRDHVINGSVIGYGAYSISIKASYEPPSQSFFLVHPERGKTVEIPIFVD